MRNWGGGRGAAAGRDLGGKIPDLGVKYPKFGVQILDFEVCPPPDLGVKAADFEVKTQDFGATPPILGGMHFMFYGILRIWG